MQRVPFKKKNQIPFLTFAFALLVTGCGGGSGATQDAPKHVSQTKDELGIQDPLSFPGFSASNNIRPIHKEQLTELHSVLTSDLTRNALNSCSERAHVWAYQQKIRNADTGKVFLFYTGYRAPGRKFPKRIVPTPTKMDWIWHTAPYVVTTEGEIYTMEKFHKVDQPMPLGDWLKHQTGGAKCVELNGTEKDISKFTCGEVAANGECTFGPPHMIEVDKDTGVPCYFRRVPSQYVYPRDVANHDYLDLAELPPLDVRSAYSMCLLVMDDVAHRSKKCMDLMSLTPSPALMGDERGMFEAQPEFGNPVQPWEE